MRLTQRNHAGRQCAWHGFDGKLYVATVESVRRGVAHIIYRVGARIVNGYIPREHHTRIEFFDSAHTQSQAGI